MPSSPILQYLELKNFLSFGEQGEALELSPLNVLIGPNGSGKSNLIEAIGLLQSAPRDLAGPIREGGGVREWLWKRPDPDTTPAVLETRVRPHESRQLPLRYRLSFTAVEQRLEITDERVEDSQPLNLANAKPHLYFGYEHGRPMLNVAIEGRSQRELLREDVDPESSILAQRRDPDNYPELTYLATTFESFKLYREWSLGRFNKARAPQPADLPSDRLLQDFGNLGLVLNHLRRQPSVKRDLKRYIGKFYPGAEDVDVSIQGGTVQVFLQEHDLVFPATRLSDGTLRWLMLLAILLNPTPPPLVCIEEPEVGLHPDMVATLADLLVQASERMQLIVTTHSDALVEALTPTPECVVVCEKSEEGTTLKRLDSDQLSQWLQHYSLGELWRKGEIGGNRW